VLPGIAVDIEHRPVARQTARGDAEVEPALGDVVEHSHPVGQLRRMMIRQKETTGGETDLPRLHQRLRDQKIGRGMRLPWRRVMLADPGFHEPEFVGPAQSLQVPVMAFIEAALRRMRGHRE
jgi:hypothetical protein